MGEVVDAGFRKDHIYKGNGFNITFITAKQGANFRDLTEPIYLPEEVLINDLVVEGGYPNKLPIGLPEGIKCKITFNTEAFPAGFRDFTKDMANNTFENRVVISRNGLFTDTTADIDYIGVQQASNKEIHTLNKKTFEINLISIHKKILEEIEFKELEKEAGYLDVTTAETEDTSRYYFDNYAPDYVTIDGAETSKFFAHSYRGWGYTRYISLEKWFSNIQSRLSEKLQLILGMHSQNITNLELPVLYQQNTTDNVKPSNELTSTDKKFIIDRIIRNHKNKEIELAGGFDLLVRDRYKNFWNFLIAYSEGLAQRIQINFVYFGAYSSLGLGVLGGFISRKGNGGEIPIDLLSGSNKDETLEIQSRNYREANARIVKGKYYSNLDRNSIKLAGGSTSKTTFECTTLLNNNACVEEFHYDWGALTRYDVKDDINKPISKLYYKMPSKVKLVRFESRVIVDDVWFLKVADHCKIPVKDGTQFISNGFENGNAELLNADGHADYSTAVLKTQENCISSLVAQIISKVICDKQIWLTINLPIEYGTINNLGKEYTIKVNDITPKNNFYEAVTYGERAVLVYFKSDYVKQVAECTFFIRSDEWA